MFVIIATLAVLAARPGASELRACVGTERLYANLDAIAAERETSGEAGWREACRQARDAGDRRRSLQKVVLATAASPMEGYGPALRFAMAAKAATGPDVAELLRRATRDSVLRGSLSNVNPKGPARGLTPLARRLYDGVLAAEAADGDIDNARWLGEAVHRRGWFTISQDGADANYAASLIVQHADADLPFKRAMLTVLEPLALRGDTSKLFFTQAYDRWAAAARQPQRFGLQGACAGPGVWEPLPIEDPQHLDERRQQFEIESFAEYKNAMGKRCP